MQKIITRNGVEVIETWTDEERFSIIHRLSSQLRGGYKVSIFNRREVKEIRDEMTDWLVSRGYE